MSTLDPSIAAAQAAKRAPFHIRRSTACARVVSDRVLSHAGLKGKVPGLLRAQRVLLLERLFESRRCCAWSSDGSRDISLKQFYLRRVFRIFPPFYLVCSPRITTGWR